MADEACGSAPYHSKSKAVTQTTNVVASIAGHAAKTELTIPPFENLVGARIECLPFNSSVILRGAGCHL